MQVPIDPATQHVLLYSRRTQGRTVDLFEYRTNVLSMNVVKGGIDAR